MNERNYSNKNADVLTERLHEMRKDLDKLESVGFVFFPADFEEHL